MPCNETPTKGTIVNELYMKLWKSRTHAIVDLSLTAIMLAWFGRKMWREHKEMKQWEATANQIFSTENNKITVVKS